MTRYISRSERRICSWISGRSACWPPSGATAESRLKSRVSLGHSDILDLEQALGQFTLYHDALEEQDPGRILYLAVPEHVRRDLFEEPIGEMLLRRQRLRLVIFDPAREELLQWIPSQNTGTS